MIFALIISVVMTVLVGICVFATLEPYMSKKSALKSKYQKIEAENKMLRQDNARIKARIVELETELVARQLGLTWVKDIEE